MRSFLILSVFAAVLAAQQPIVIEAPITGVRLHPDEAWVTRVGKVRLPAQGTHKLQLEALPHKAVRVACRRVEQKFEQVGSFSKERQWLLREQIELDNDGAEVLDVEVQDRILKPVSDQVKINLLPEFTTGWTEPIPGVRSWKLKLAPKEQKRLELPITIRAPKEGIVTGMEAFFPKES